MGRPGKRYKINNINLYVYLPRVGFIRILSIKYLLKKV